MLPKVLAAHAFPTSAFLARVPLLLSAVAHRIAAHAGVSRTRFSGSTANDILTAATATLAEQRRGLILLHWPDGDRVGHAHGWMSDRYAEAAREMDRELGRLVRMIGLDDPSTLLIALADHGGGGAVIDHHDSDHPLDQTIPIMLAGGAVRRGELPRGSSLLDVPATIAWALGIPIPSSFAGKPLTQCFAMDPSAVAA